MPFPLQVTDFLLCSQLAMINSYNCSCNQGESQNSKIWLQGLGSSLLLRPYELGLPPPQRCHATVGVTLEFTLVCSQNVSKHTCCLVKGGDMILHPVSVD